MASHPLRSPLVGCTWTGNKFAGREAGDRFLCRLFLGGPHAQELILSADDDRLASTALAALRSVCPFLPERPLARWITRWPHGNPAYRVGHLDWLAKLRRAADDLGNLSFCGSSYDGVSVSDCIRQAQTLTP